MFVGDGYEKQNNKIVIMDEITDLLISLRQDINNCETTEESRGNLDAILNAKSALDLLEPLFLLSVSNKRELLIAFLMEVDEVHAMHIRENAEKCVDNYLSKL